MTFVDGVSGAEGANGRAKPQQDHWPDPVDLPGLPPVPAFREELLPDALRPWLSDVVERTQCPPEYPAVGAIVALASVIGRLCGLRPKCQDDWLVIANLWGAVVGGPSTMKSPALDEATRFVRWLAANSAEEHEGRAYERKAIDAKRKAFEAEMAQAAKKKVDLSAWQQRYDEIEVECAEAGAERRFIVYDATVEALGVILRDSKRGVLLYRDELIGWFRSLDRLGHENDRGFYLSAWNGNGDYVYDRITRGTVIIKHACVSILGGIQPGPLGSYLRAAVNGGDGDDGLMQRFQLLVYPDPPRSWKNVDRWPDTAARERAREVFFRLANATPEQLQASANADSEIPFLRFDAAAQEFFDGWRHGLENRLRTSGEHPAIEAHLSKYRSLLPSLALIFHLADEGVGAVGLHSAARAAAWCTLLEGHMRRVYAAVAYAEVSGARTLLAKIRGGALDDQFTVRDLKRKQWAGLAEPGTVEAAIAKLAEYGWVRQTLVPTGGRPSDVVEVHPCLRRRQ